MITRTNEAKTLEKHISYECKCDYGAKNVIRMKNGVVISVNFSVKTNLGTCACE